MGEMLITICGKTLQAWEFSGTPGKRTASLVASSEITDEVFSPEGGERIREFLRSLNGGDEEKVEEQESRSPLLELISRAKIPMLERFFKTLNGSERKRQRAGLLISDIDLFIRKVDLPFDDLQKARLAAPSVVTTTLPFEGGVLIDLIPLHAGEGEGRFLAVCVRQQEIEQLEEVFSRADFLLEQVVPGFLLLLTSLGKGENENRSGIYLDGKIAAKASLDWHASGSVRIMPLALVEEEFKGEKRDREMVIDMSGKNGVPGEPGKEWIRGLNDDLVDTYLNHPVLSGFNLISAKITEFRESALKRTKKVVFIASALLLSLSLIFTIEGTKHFNRKKAESVRGLMAKKFGELMKGTTMVEPVAQLKDKIASMEDDLALFPSKETPFYSLLVSLSSNVKGDDGIAIREINFTRGKLTVTGEAPDQERVTELKNRLSREGDRDVEITETGPSATEGLVKFKLTIT